MSVKLNTVDSVMAIIQAERYNGGNIRTSAAHYKRVVRALHQLCLPPIDRERVLSYLDYHGDDEMPYPWLARALAPKAKP